MITWGTYHITGSCKLTSVTSALLVCAGPALFGTSWHYAWVTLPYLFLLHCLPLLFWRRPSPGVHFSNINQPIQSPHPNYSPYLAFTLWGMHLSYYRRARAQTAGATSATWSPLRSFELPNPKPVYSASPFVPLHGSHSKSCCPQFLPLFSSW